MSFKEHNITVADGTVIPLLILEPYDVEDLENDIKKLVAVTNDFAEKMTLSRLFTLRNFFNKERFTDELCDLADHIRELQNDLLEKLEFSDLPQHVEALKDNPAYISSRTLSVVLKDCFETEYNAFVVAAEKVNKTLTYKIHRLKKPSYAIAAKNHKKEISRLSL